MQTMLVWKSVMRTYALSVPEKTLTAMSKICGVSAWRTSIGVFSRNSPIVLICSGVMEASTCSSAEASPAATPAAAAAGRPLSPPVFGTTTLLTFLMMLPLASTSTRSGMTPRVSRAFAAA